MIRGSNTSIYAVIMASLLEMKEKNRTIISLFFKKLFETINGRNTSQPSQSAVAEKQTKKPQNL